MSRQSKANVFEKRLNQIEETISKYQAKIADLEKEKKAIEEERKAREKQEMLEMLVYNGITLDQLKNLITNKKATESVEIDENSDNDK